MKNRYINNPAQDSQIGDSTKKIDCWYVQELTHGDKIRSWVLNENNEHIVQSKFQTTKKNQTPKQIS